MGDLSTALDHGVRTLTRHWMSVWIVGLGVFVALPWLAPVLSAMGYDGVAGWIYLIYRPTCHQLPHHSWFLFGPDFTPEWKDVHPYTAVPFDAPLRSFHTPLRNPLLGYQSGICQRDSAIFGALFLGSLAYVGLVRGGHRPRGLPFAWYAIAVVPTLLDGVTQLFGWRASTPLLRTSTGMLLGLATAAFVLPRLREGFEEFEGGEV